MLFGILQFNLFGYQILHAYLEERAGHQFQCKLDNNSYDETSLISIKVPAKHLSHNHQFMQFEKFNGQIVICGVAYCYVKCMLYNDTIELLCIPNQKVVELQKTENVFFAMVNDLKPLSQGKKSGSHSNKNFSGDSFDVQDPFQLESPVYHVNNNIFCCVASIPVHTLFSDEHPPEKTA